MRVKLLSAAMTLGLLAALMPLGARTAEAACMRTSGWMQYWAVYTPHYGTNVGMEQDLCFDGTTWTYPRPKYSLSRLSGTPGAGVWSYLGSGVYKYNATTMDSYLDLKMTESSGTLYFHPRIKFASSTDPLNFSTGTTSWNWSGSGTVTIREGWGCRIGTSGCPGL